MGKASYEVVDFGVTKYGEKAKKFILKGAGGVILEAVSYTHLTLPTRIKV